MRVATAPKFGSTIAAQVTKNKQPHFYYLNGARATQSRMRYHVIRRCLHFHLRQKTKKTTHRQRHVL